MRIVQQVVSTQSESVNVKRGGEGYKVVIPNTSLTKHFYALVCSLITYKNLNKIAGSFYSNVKCISFLNSNPTPTLKNPYNTTNLVQTIKLNNCIIEILYYAGFCCLFSLTLFTYHNDVHRFPAGLHHLHLPARSPDHDGQRAARFRHRK